MATSLLISFPDIPHNAVTNSIDDAAAGILSEFNVITGERRNRYQSTNSATSFTFTYDLENNIEQSADHIIVAHGDWVNTSGFWDTLTVSRSTPGALTAEFTDTTPDAPLVGPNGTDYISEFTESSTYEHWEVKFDYSSSAILRASKIYLGKLFDIGADPDDYTFRMVTDDSPIEYADDGGVWFRRAERPVYEYTITWRGISDTNTETFTDKAQDPDLKYCFLYAKTVGDVLNNETLLHTVITSFATERIASDWNLVTATFREMYG